MTPISCLRFLWALPAIVACSWAQPAPETRTVRVAVSVEAPAGTPVSGLPIGLASGSEDSLRRTGMDGRVTLQGTFPADATLVYVHVLPFVKAGDYPEMDQDLDRYLEVTAAHAFERTFKIDLAGGVEDYVLPIVGRESFRLTARPTSGGQPIRATAIHRYTRVPVVSKEDGTPTVVEGLPADQVVDVFFYVVADERIVVRSLPETAAGTTVDLGELGIDPWVPGRRVQITVANAHELKGNKFRRRGRNLNITLVSSDGKPFGALLDRDGLSVREDRPERPLLELQPGTYYLCPGLLDGDGLPTRLWKLLRDGRLADVEAAQVPKVVVDTVTGDVINLTIDGPQTETSIQSIQP